jgi:hypothetical protein
VFVALIDTIQASLCSPPLEEFFSRCYCACQCRGQNHDKRGEWEERWAHGESRLEEEKEEEMKLISGRSIVSKRSLLETIVFRLSSRECGRNAGKVGRTRRDSSPNLLRKAYINSAMAMLESGRQRKYVAIGDKRA